MISRLIRTAALVALFSVSVDHGDRAGRRQRSDRCRQGQRWRRAAGCDGEGHQPGAPVSSVEAITNGEGVYNIPSLAPGPYRVEAALDGFESVSAACDRQ